MNPSPPNGGRSGGGGSSSRKNGISGHQMYTIPQANDLIKNAANLLDSSDSLLAEAREICKQSGLSVDSSILDASYQSQFLPKSPFQPSVYGNSDRQSLKKNKANNDIGSGNGSGNSNGNGVPKSDVKDDKDEKEQLLKAYPPILSTTGGHSNIDHIIQYTGDYRSDTIAEYKRKLKRRMRSLQPEQRGTDRWDLPRIAGSRRRRIHREIDLPWAPPEPPPSGYVIFISHMTTKIRHDRPNVAHDQIQVVKEISKVWKSGMSDDDRNYYNDFYRETREEYEKQHAEYRATGKYKPSKVFERLHGDGPWVRIAYHEKNSLEREISEYDSVKFPPRPPEMEKPAWEKRIEEAREKENERRKVREERAKMKRESVWKELEEAHKAKVKRLAEIT